MGRLFQITATKSKGVIVGSLFAVPKVGGFSLKWKSKIRNEKNELVDITGKELMESLLESGCFEADAQGRTKGMLILKNNRKTSEKAPEYLVYAYPKDK